MLEFETSAEVRDASVLPREPRWFEEWIKAQWPGVIWDALRVWKALYKNWLLFILRESSVWGDKLLYKIISLWRSLRGCAHLLSLSDELGRIKLGDNALQHLKRKSNESDDVLSVIYLCEKESRSVLLILLVKGRDERYKLFSHHVSVASLCLF